MKNSRFSCSQYNFVGSFHYFKINLWVNFLCVKNIHQFKCACIQDKSTLGFLEGVRVIVCYIRTRNVQLGIFFITTIHWDKTEDKGHMLMHVSQTSSEWLLLEDFFVCTWSSDDFFVEIYLSKEWKDLIEKLILEIDGMRM